MSTLELEHLKHTSSSSNNLSVHSDGSLTLGNLQSLSVSGNTSLAGRLQVGDSSITQAYPAANLGYVMDVQASTGNQTYISIAEPGTSSLGDNGMIIGEDTTHSWIVQRGNKGMNFSTNDLGRLLIDASGRVSTPYQPAFQAKRSNHVTGSGTIVFDAVQFNIGNHYNSSNGIFTAPVNGQYLFTFSCLLYNMGSSSNAHLFVNGSAYNMSSFGTYGQFTGSYAGQGASIVASLSTNDQVTINFTNNGTNLHSGYTWWSGAKIG